MKLNPREKKVVIFGVSLAAVVMLVWAVIAFLPSPSGLAREVETNKSMLLRYREMIGREDAYKARGAQIQQRLDRDLTRLLPGDNASIAGAELQKVLKEIADQNGVEVSRRDIRPQQKAQNNLAKISVNMDTNCTPEQLVRMLAAIENYGKYLSVDELNISAFRQPRGYVTRQTMTITGYIAVPESQSGDKSPKK